MLEDQPPASPGRMTGLILMAGIILLDAALLFLAIATPIGLLTILWALLLISSFPVLAAVAYWTGALSRARYRLQDRQLVIDWGGIGESVPLRNIRAVHLGSSLDRIGRFRGIRWPGLLVGRGELAKGEQETRPVAFYATRPPAGQVLLVTDEVTYAISPADPELFVVSFQALQERAGADAEGLELTRPGLHVLALWQDRLAQITIGLAILLNGIQFALLAAIYRGLPGQVPLHFDSAGVADRLGAPPGLFILPLVGLIAWITISLVGLYIYQVQGERTIARILWGATVAVEIGTWVALLQLLSV